MSLWTQFFKCLGMCDHLFIHIYSLTSPNSYNDLPTEFSNWEHYKLSKRRYSTDIISILNQNKNKCLVCARFPLPVTLLNNGRPLLSTPFPVFIGLQNCSGINWGKVARALIKVHCRSPSMNFAASSKRDCLKYCNSKRHG